jgi:non-specific serine/threonine protein kinase
MEHAHRHALRPYHAVAVCVRGSIAAERGNPEAGIHDLGTSLAEMRQANYLLFYPLFRCRLATILDSAGRTKESAQEIDETLQLALDVGYRWIVPEILRVKGELLQRHDPGSVASSEELFRRAMDQARAQNALYWELSAAASLAELLLRQGRSREGQAILAPVHARLIEGRDAPRVLWARGLLERLGAAS